MSPFLGREHLIVVCFWGTVLGSEGKWNNEKGIEDYEDRPFTLQPLYNLVNLIRPQVLSYKMGR